MKPPLLLVGSAAIPYFSAEIAPLFTIFPIFPLSSLVAAVALIPVPFDRIKPLLIIFPTFPELDTCIPKLLSFPFAEIKPSFVKVPTLSLTLLLPYIAIPLYSPPVLLVKIIPLFAIVTASPLIVPPSEGMVIPEEFPKIEPSFVKVFVFPIRYIPVFFAKIKPLFSKTLAELPVTI